MNRTFSSHPILTTQTLFSIMTLRNRSKVEIGVVPTHLMFVGTLAPDESGKLPRTRSGDLKVVSGMRLLCRTSPVKLNNVQITLFPGTDPRIWRTCSKGFAPSSSTSTSS